MFEYIRCSGDIPEKVISDYIKNIEYPSIMSTICRKIWYIENKNELKKACFYNVELILNEHGEIKRPEPHNYEAMEEKDIRKLPEKYKKLEYENLKKYQTALEDYKMHYEKRELFIEIIEKEDIIGAFRVLDRYNSNDFWIRSVYEFTVDSVKKELEDEPPF
jgi:hypothetical protein